MASTWLSYNELAWTEDVLADPADYEDEVSVYVDMINREAPKPPRTLLHLGSGAGGHDTVFKRHFTVTGVDISAGMLNKARALHPDIDYHEGDMRSVRLNRVYDVVAIPDSIDYMATRKDLGKAVQTASAHLRTGGVFLLVAKPAETFQNNNFVYTGEKDGVHVTLFENNHINQYRPETYEATLVYLIRKQGELTVRTENQVLGLFPRAVWEQVFSEAGLVMRTATLDGVYGRYILNDGSYPLTIFVGHKA